MSFVPPVSEDTLRVFQGLPVERDLCPRLSPTSPGDHTSHKRIKRTPLITANYYS